MAKYSEEITQFKKSVKPGFKDYLMKNNPEYSEGSIDTWISDSFYLLNNDYEELFFAYIDSKIDREKVKSVIMSVIAQKRGPEKADGNDYYSDKLDLLKEYINKAGGLTEFK